MSSLPIVEIINFGNELLNGRTTNTNATFLGKHLAAAGFHISRIQMIEDSKTTDIAAIKETIQRKPRVLIITGGLGPTWDDIIAECLSIAIDRPLTRNLEAEKLMKDAYARFNLNIKPEAYKMVDLPEGGTPIPNSVGTAPGIHVSFPDIDIFALPGVPSEMKAMITEEVTPRIQGLSSSHFFEERFLVEGVPESYLAETIKKIRDEFNPVWVKSHPMGTEGTPRIEFQLTLNSTNVEDYKLVQNAVTRLKAAIKKKFKDSAIISST